MWELWFILYTCLEPTCHCFRSLASIFYPANSATWTAVAFIKKKKKIRNRSGTPFGVAILWRILLASDNALHPARGIIIFTLKWLIHPFTKEKQSQKQISFLKEIFLHAVLLYFIFRDLRKVPNSVKFFLIS